MCHHGTQGKHLVSGKPFGRSSTVRFLIYNNYLNLQGAKMFLALPPCQACKNRKLNFANGRWHRHSDGLEHFAAHALCFAAHRQAVAVFFYASLLQRLQTVNCVSLPTNLQPLKFNEVDSAANFTGPTKSTNLTNSTNSTNSPFFPDRTA